MTEEQSSGSERGTENSTAKNVSADPFPVATVKSTGGGLLRQSRMWWITLVCLLLAVLLAWQSIPDEGPQITIRFPEGHGLKAGDAVRFRGINVGLVTAVSLNEQLSNVTVHVTLTPDAAALTRKGTRFWIVRPRLSLTEISGLETAVGAKYIGVSPGRPTDPKRTDFDGLATAPPDELAGNGLELVLQSDDRHGISLGAPVSWRGVEVGRVLSSGLSPDARHVNITIRIDGSYRRLVRSNSKFWVASGFDVDVGIRGVKVNAQSLATIVRGGISLITPDASNGEEVSTGDVFTLEKKADDEWLESSDGASLIDFSLPETVIVSGKRESSFLGIRRNKSVTQSGILTSGNGGLRLVTAMLAVDEESEHTTLVDFLVQPVGAEAVTFSEVKLSDCQVSADAVISIPVIRKALSARAIAIRSRELDIAEDCLAVRSAFRNDKVISVTLPIDRSQLVKQIGSWRVQDAARDFDGWNGTPVVAVSDGNIVGLLVIGGEGPVVVPVSE